MLKECIETFDKKLQKYLDETGKNERSFIIERYKLSDGDYILLDPNTGSIKERLKVSKDSDSSESLYKKFAAFDYLSKLLGGTNKAIGYNKSIDETNKPNGQQKIIHSNNYLSFFVKKESLNGKLTEDIIKGYYSFFKNPMLKYKKDKKSKKIYSDYESRHGGVNSEQVENLQGFILNFFDKEKSLIEELKEDKKNYLKIFFDSPIEDFIRESNRYLLPNIYNTNDFNYENEETNEIFGLPNCNMGMNVKKPFLENKTRKNTKPYFLSQKDVLKQKIFFDYLMTFAANREYNIFIDNNDIRGFQNGQFPKGIFNGYYLRIKKGKECEIHDFCTISLKSDKLGLDIKDVLNINYGTYSQNLNYQTKINTFDELFAIVNEVLYSKCLFGNLFSEPKEIRISGKLKELILLSRNAWINWFYKGDKHYIKRIFDKVSLEIIKNSLSNDFAMKAKEQYNLKCAISDYLNKKDESMNEKVQKITSALELKINSKEPHQIDNDDEFYFAVGELCSYFISLNRSSKKHHSLINPILRALTAKKLKKELFKMFEKYNYNIETKSLRFKNLYGMICLYEPNEKVNYDMLLGGYLSQSLMYKKGEEADE